MYLKRMICADKKSVKFICLLILLIYFCQLFFASVTSLVAFFTLNHSAVG